jgi:hypothetical protein
VDAVQLERLVRETHVDPLRREAVLQALAVGKVALLFNRGVVNGKLPREARPLVLNGHEDAPVIAAFTSVDMTKPWVQREPEFGFALYTDFEWVVRITPPGVGIAINPGYQFDFSITAAQVQAMKRVPGVSVQAQPQA